MSESTSETLRSEDIAALVSRGRDAYARRAWDDAHAALATVYRLTTLELGDLERFAWAAIFTGRDAPFFDAAERIHQLYATRGEAPLAARWALWMMFRAQAMGEPARSGAYRARAERILTSTDCECSERGWLLVAKAYQLGMADQFDAAERVAAEAIAIGERCCDPDLIALARTHRGRALVCMGQIEPGLSLMDESMLAAASDELSPLITGLVYCSLITGCHQVYAYDRAREWTSALARWCDTQPQLVIFTGTCQVHRAQLLQLGGAWNEAIEEARRAAATRTHTNPTATAEAFYQQAEVHRLRGQFADAEAAYRSASQYGSDPQPGLGLLRMAQGRSDLAAQALRRALAAHTDPMRRVRYLPAYVEVMLSVGDVTAARDACDELARIASELRGEVIGAMAAHARGMVLAATGAWAQALVPLRAALDVWQRLDAPYIAARVRVLLACACRDLGDRDGAALELDAARAIFARLGAAPDLAGLEPPSKRTTQNNLSPRELEVLRLVAAGKTNKQIARELGVAEKTIDRHVSNIFGKLDVSTRAAATAFAYEHGLV